MPGALMAGSSSEAEGRREETVRGFMSVPQKRLPRTGRSVSGAAWCSAAVSAEVMM